MIVRSCFCDGCKECYLNVLRHVPSEVDHGHDGLVSLALVPLVPLDGGHVLSVCERPRVPGHIVAPAAGLDPVDTARVDPDQLPRPLHEPVARDAGLHEVLHLGPPAPVQVVHLVELALLLQRAPVLVRHPEPFTVAWTNVEVDCCKVVVFLMAWSPSPRNLEHISVAHIHHIAMLA